MTKSPWSRPFKDSGEAAPLSLEEKQAEWIRQETSELLSFLNSERHATLQHAVRSVLPRFPNQVYAFQLLPMHAMHFDEISNAVIMLAQGGQSVDDLAQDFLDLETDDQDHMTFLIHHLDRLTELELAKQSAGDEIGFKTLYLQQVLTLAELYEDNLALENRNGEISDYSINTIKFHIQKRVESSLDFSLPQQPPQSIDHWPMVAPIARFVGNLQHLSMQSAATIAHLNRQAGELAYDDPKIDGAIRYAEAVDGLVTSLGNNLMQFVKDEVYFIDLASAMNDLANLYGEQGHSCDTPWEMDENIAIQTLYTIFSNQIIGDLQGDGLDDDDPAFFAILVQARSALEEIIEEQYPVQQDKKPTFIIALEERAMHSLLAESQDDDKMGIDSPSGRPKPAPRL